MLEKHTECLTFEAGSWAEQNKQTNSNFIKIKKCSLDFANLENVFISMCSLKRDPQSPFLNLKTKIV